MKQPQSTVSSTKKTKVKPKPWYMEVIKDFGTPQQRKVKVRVD